MPPPLKLALAVAVLAALMLPAAFVVTLLLYPLWSWIEATFGVEAVGHSGPADWCFETVYGVLVAAVAVVVVQRWWKGRRGDAPLS